MTKMNLTVAIIIGIALSVLGILFLSKSTVLNKNVTNNSVVNDSTQPMTNKEADTVIQVKSNDASSYDLSIMTTTPKKLSGLSIRLTYPYKGGDYSNQSFIPNPELIANGWVFPIKSVNLNQTSNMIVIDISGINPTTTGYDLSNEVSLGTLSNFSSLTFNLDKSETKILEKSGEESVYTFKQ